MNRPGSHIAAPPKLVLEPVRASSRFHSFPLAPGRYLIGSGDDCDLIIPVAGVAPQHCLIVVGTNRTIVKALSPLTWIDDGPLSESVLQHGQKLILGPIELRTRRPDVSEWLEVPANLGSESEAPSAAPYEPPRIDELLDHARQQLENAIADELPTTESWSEDLPLTEAVDRHAQSVLNEATEHLKDAELERQALEVGERARAIDYLSSELNVRERALEERERSLQTRESTVATEQQQLDSLRHELTDRDSELQELHASIRRQNEEFLERIAAIQEHEKALELQKSTAVEVEQQLLARHQALTTREEQLLEQQAALNQSQEQYSAREASLAGQQSELEGYRVDLLHREEQIESQLVEFVRQKEEFAQQASQRQDREAEWVAQESELRQRIQTLEDELSAQSNSPEPVTAPVGLIDSQVLDGREEDLKYREESVTRRESVLAQSLASLRTAQEQLREEASEIDSRFADLMRREQALPARLVALKEEVRQAEAQLTQVRLDQAELLRSLQEREQQWEVRTATLTEREAALLQSQKGLELRERELRNLRSELDIREEALAQQYAQLQLDRSTLRAAQSRLQLAEQSLQQREAQITQLASLPTASQTVDPEFETREQAVADLAQECERRMAELTQREEQLVQRESGLQLREAELESIRHQIDTQRADLERDQQTLQALQLEHESQVQQLASTPAGGEESQATLDELTRQLESLVQERETVSRLQADVQQEHLGLKAERDELRKIRQQFDLERDQFQELRQQAQTERDTFLLERQAIITERQALRDRERLVQSTEAETSRHQTEAQQALEELQVIESRLAEERTHLEEEWETLRQERAKLAESEAHLDAQREELSELAQNLSQLQSGLTDTGIDEVPQLADEEIPASSEFSVPVSEEPVDADQIPEATGTLVSDEPDLESELDENPIEDVEPDALAGFASFSTIGQTEDGGIPPEVAEILRKTAGQHSAPQPAAPPPVPKSVTGRLDAMLGLGKSASPDSTQAERRRLEELLARPTDDFVDAATQVVADESELQSEYEGEETEVAELETDESESLMAVSTDEVPSDESEIDTHETVAPASGPSDDIRSRLSEMFGINLGGARKSAPVPPPANEEVEEYTEEPEYDEQYEEEPVAEESEPVAESTESSSDNLDPVAAYMEQLLARTRKGKSEVPPAPVKKAVEPPPVVAPVVPVKVEKIAEPEPEPEPEEVQRATRKLDAAEKEAMRANMDSFRTIANSQARSDVARSELRRLKVNVKVKRVFVGVSAVIFLVLLSTVFWADRHYFLEILAALISTAFLSIDFVRTEKRLRELAAVMPDDDEPPVF